MVGVLATFRHGTVELSESVKWPEGTQLEVIPIRSATASPANGNGHKGESYRDFIQRLAGSFGDEPFERPVQGEFEQREEW